MPVRVLDASGEGDAATIAQGIRSAVTHGTHVINLSLEFPIGTPPGGIAEGNCSGGFSRASSAGMRRVGVRWLGLR